MSEPQLYSGFLVLRQLQSLQVAAIEYLQCCHARVDLCFGEGAAPRQRATAVTADWEQNAIYTANLSDQNHVRRETLFCMTGRNDAPLVSARLGVDDKLHGWKTAQHAIIDVELYVCFLACVYSCVVQECAESSLKVLRSDVE